MTIIAGKPFTQLLNLNILDELRVDGELIVPGGSPPQQIVPQTGNYSIDVSDDIVYFTIASDATAFLLASASSAKSLVIKNSPISTANVIVQPAGIETVENELTQTLSPGQSITIFPIVDGYLIE